MAQDQALQSKQAQPDAESAAQAPLATSTGDHTTFTSQGVKPPVVGAVATAAPTASDQAFGATAATTTTGVQQLQRLLQQGSPTAAAVAQLIAANATEHDQMVALLQQTLGTAFVQQVLAVAPATGSTGSTSAKPAAPTATPAPAAGGKAPAPTPAPAAPQGVSIDPTTGALVVTGPTGTDTTTLTGDPATKLDGSTAIATSNGFSASASGEVAPDKTPIGVTTTIDPLTGKPVGEGLGVTGKAEIDDKTADNTLKITGTADTTKHQFTGAGTDTAKIGDQTVTVDGSGTDADSKTSEKFDASAAGTAGSVKVDGGLDQGKGIQNGGLQLQSAGANGSGKVDAGVELTHTDATVPAPLPAGSKKKPTAPTPADLNVGVNAGFTNDNVKIEGTGSEDVSKGSVGGGVTVTDLDKTSKLKGDSVGVNVLDTNGLMTTTVAGTAQAGDNAITGTVTADQVKNQTSVGVTDTVGGTGPLKGLKVGTQVTDAAGLVGTNSSASLTDASGNATSLGVTTDHTKGDAITASEQIKSGALAGTTLTDSTGILKGAVTEQAGVQFQKGGVTASGSVGTDPVNGFGATATVEDKLTTKDGVNVDASANVTANQTGVHAGAIVGADKTLKNGVDVGGAAGVTVDNGIVGGGGAIGVEKGQFGAQVGGEVGTDGVSAEVQVEVPHVIIGVVATDGLITRIRVQLTGNHPILNPVLDVAGDVAVAAINPAGFGIELIEKIALHGAPAGLDKLIAVAGGGKLVDDASGKSDAMAKAAVKNAVLVLTADDLKYLDEMKMTKNGKIDGTIEPELFLQRVKESPLTPDQQAALAHAYKVASANIDHARLHNVSGVEEVFALVQKGVKDPQQYANLMDAHPDDMLTMMQEIVISQGYGLPFANNVAAAAGIVDTVVQKADGSIAFAKPVETAAPVATPAPASTPAPAAVPVTGAPAPSSSGPAEVIAPAPVAAGDATKATTTVVVPSTTTTPTVKTPPAGAATPTPTAADPAKPKHHWFDIFK